MKERNVLLDVLKGFAILLVILGHSIQYNQINDFDQNPLFRFIYSFHMPFFMFLSGFVSYKTFDGSLKKLWARFKSLIIPYWSWFFVTFIFSYLMYWWIGGEIPDFAYSIKQVFISPDIGLWFLWVLFLNYAVLFISLKLSKHFEEFWMIVALILIAILMQIIHLDILGIGLLRWHLLFYILGYIINKYGLSWPLLIHRISILSMLVFPVLVCSWSRISNPIIFDSWSIEPILKTLLYYLFKLTVPITGILSFYKIFGYLIQYNFWFKNSLRRLGLMSMELYATQFYFFNFLFLFAGLPLGVRIPITFTLTLLGSILVQAVIKRNKFLTSILYGKFSKS